MASIKILTGCLMAMLLCLPVRMTSTEARRYLGPEDEMPTFRRRSDPIADIQICTKQIEDYYFEGIIKLPKICCRSAIMRPMCEDNRRGQLYMI